MIQEVTSLSCINIKYDIMPTDPMATEVVNNRSFKH